MNKIFESDFEISKNSPIHEGFDIILTSDEYELGLNILDFHGDAIERWDIVKFILDVLPKDIWLII